MERISISSMVDQSSLPNRYVMPLDVLGHTHAILTVSASMSYADRCGESCETLSCGEMIFFEILDHR